MISLSVEPGDGETQYYNKQGNELQEGVTIEGTKISGTLKKVTGYKLFGDDDEHTESHNLVLKLSSDDADKIETEMDGSTHMHGYVEVDDGFCVYRVDDKDTQKIRVKATKGNSNVVKEYDLSGLTLEE